MNPRGAELITLAHGGGGARTSELIREIFQPVFDNPILHRLDDSACLDIEGVHLAFTTDSYVVKPLFFPGGDIGRLAVCGTVNDLAMQGARPLYLTAGFVLEEGLPVADLQRIVRSMRGAAREAGVSIVAGDTKVVERGGEWGMFINTAGIGLRVRDTDPSVARAQPGDVVIVTGTIGEHAIAVLSGRDGIAFSTHIGSDVAPLSDMIMKLLEAVPDVHVLRDPTRGGLAAALNDIAQASRVGIRLREEAMPVRPEVRGACSLLGIDPLSAANEGKALVIVSDDDCARALEVLRAHPMGRNAVAIGAVTTEPVGRVLLETTLGGERIVDVPLGEDLPRIC